jgi:hypothetical protein
MYPPVGTHTSELLHEKILSSKQPVGGGENCMSCIGGHFNSIFKIGGHNNSVRGTGGLSDRISGFGD